MRATTTKSTRTCAQDQDESTTSRNSYADISCGMRGGASYFEGNGADTGQRCTGMDLQVQQISKQKADRDRRLTGSMQRIKVPDLFLEKAEGMLAKLRVG